MIKADGNALRYVLAEVVARAGHLCPLADNQITFRVEGAGYNTGVDNGSPTSLERFKSDRRKAFYGKAMLIVRNNGQEGPVTVTASSPGLRPYTATINSNAK